MAREDEIVDAYAQGHITKDEAQQLLAQKPDLVQSAKGMASDAMGAVPGLMKAAGTGLADAATGLAGIPGMLTKFNPRGPQLPDQSDIKQAIGDRTGQSLYKPQTQLERYASSAAEGMGSVLPFTKGQALFGLALGAGGQVGEDTINKTGTGRLMGMAPVLAAGIPMLGHKPQSVKALQDRLAAIPEADFQQGFRNAGAASKELGTQVYEPQGMDRRAGVVSDLFDMMKTRPKGQQLMDGLYKQQEAGASKSMQIAKTLQDNGLADSVLNSAVTGEGRMDSSLLKEIPAQWRGVPGSNKAADFNNQISTLATQRGLNPIDTVQKANDLLDAMTIASREQGAVPSAKGEIAEGAKKGFFTTFLNNFGFYAPVRGVGEWAKDYKFNKMLDNMINATQDGELFAKAQQIIKFSNMEHKTKAVARGMLGAGVAEQDDKTRPNY